MTDCRRCVLLPLLLTLALALTGCTQEVPITGRRQLSLVPAAQLRTMGFQQYDAFLQKHQTSADVAAAAMVRRCGRRIQQAVEQYFADAGQGDSLAGYAWEYNLVQDEQANAFCMPGGKVAVYTGILPLTRDETGLAVVLAHEIAHAVAQHARERMSQAMLTSLGGAALGLALEKHDAKTRNLFLGLYGAGTTVGYMLPHSRQQEAEADRLGLIFMAMAGYDPRAAVGLWERMRDAKRGKGQPPVFLSTHPSDSQRIASIRRLLPEALSYYRAPSAGGAAPRAAAETALARVRRENEALREALAARRAE